VTLVAGRATLRRLAERLNQLRPGLSASGRLALALDDPDANHGLESYRDLLRQAGLSHVDIRRVGGVTYAVGRVDSTWPAK
jgi:hypothetical protein